MKISVKSDIKQLTKKIGAFGDQIPFATSQALNATAFEARGGTIEQLHKDIDRPTPFTTGGVRYKKGNKRNLTALIEILPSRWRYLKFQVQGGIRRPRRAAIAVAAGVRRNRYGNPPRGSVARLLARPDTFSATIQGTAGIWQRTKRGGLKLLYSYQQSVSYKGGRFQYEAAVSKVVRTRFNYHFRIAILKAIKSVRLR